MTRFSTATTMIFAAAITAIALISLPAVESQTTTCVSKLVPCFSALNTTTTPPKVCCDSIKEAVEKELSCLCTVYTTGLLAQFNVSTTQALNLSDRCGVKTDLSACSGKILISDSMKFGISNFLGCFFLWFRTDLISRCGNFFRILKSWFEK